MLSVGGSLDPPRSTGDKQEIAMSLDQQYAAEISLAATSAMIAALKPTNMKRTAAYHCRKAQALRRQIEGRA